MSKFSIFRPSTWFQASVDGSGSWSFFDLFASQTKSGVKVGAREALSIPVVWACIGVLSDAAAGLPLKVYQDKDGLREEVKDTKHDARRIKRPNQFVSMPDFIKFIITNMCLSGNAFAMIERNGQGEPIRIIPVQYNLVTIVVDDDGLVGYEVLYNGQTIPVSYMNMLHFKINSLDGIMGLNPISNLADSMGISVAARDWAGAFMKSGGWSGGYVIYDSFLGDEQREQIKKNIPDIRKGRDGVGGVGILHGGPKVVPVGISPKDSQFIETQHNQDEVLSGAYRVPMWIINRMRSGSYVGSGLEQQVIAFLMFGLDPYLQVIETELNFKIMDQDEGRFCEFTRQAMLQMDSGARSEFYSKALGGSGRQGYMSVNEVRKRENLPLLDGEQYNEVSLLIIGEQPEKTGESNGD